MSSHDNPIVGINTIFDQIKDHTLDIFKNQAYADSFLNRFQGKNINRLTILIRETYWNNYCPGKSNSSLLSNLMTARGKNNGVITARADFAKYIHDNFPDLSSEGITLLKTFLSADTICDSFSLSNLPLVEQALRPRQDMQEKQPSRRIIKAALLHMFHRKDFAVFFWWLFLFALCQNNIDIFVDCTPKTQYHTIAQSLDHSLNLPIVMNEPSFMDLRRTLVETATGEIYIAGSSLKNAFEFSNERTRDSFVPELENAITSGRLKNIHIFLTDPEVFTSANARKDIDVAIGSLQENFYELAEHNQCHINVYFIALPQIDHAVITDEFMLFRSTKLWSEGRDYKGDFMLYPADYYSPDPSLNEYKAHRDYLKVIIQYCTRIYPAIDKPLLEPEPNSAASLHKQWRDHLDKKKYEYINYHKLYEQQIFSFANSTWSRKNMIGEITSSANSDTAITSYEDLSDANMLLGDETQAALLPYIKETEMLFNQAIEKHGHPHNTDGFARLIPSCDLGFPNNVQRLAGGFATGMLVLWQCFVDIVPVDATVNVCTSSVFKLDPSCVDPKWLDPENGFDRFCGFVDELSKKASKDRGYSFAFLSGNHFLMLAQDSETKEYYLVLHSSANELKKSYMGLYPVENNWYSNKIKYVYNKEHTRYFRYLKDVDARYFIQMAHNFQGYNEQIHQYIAEQFNSEIALSKENDQKSRWLYHHYYMPNNHSICIGAFAERPGTQVPVFSTHGKPIYLFEIGQNNWTVNLGGEKGRVCIIPHGWGQEIERIKDISVQNADDLNGRILVLRFDDDTEEERIAVKSSNKIDLLGKHIRSFDHPEDFFRIGSRYMSGKIVKTLKPILEYSSYTVNTGEK